MMRYQNNREVHRERKWWKATLAGFIGTIPMTIFMLLTQRLLPKGEQYNLPPEIITSELAHRAHLKHHMDKRQILIATLISHFGYGAAVGTLYSPLEQRKFLPASVQGALFGVLVWAGGYLCGLPFLGMKEKGQTEPLRRNLMMIAAHIVWGSTTGITTAALTRTD